MNTSNSVYNIWIVEVRGIAGTAEGADNNPPSYQG